MAFPLAGLLAGGVASTVAKGVGLGAASFGASKALGNFFPGEEEAQQAQDPAAMAQEQQVPPGMAPVAQSLQYGPPAMYNPAAMYGPQAPYMNNTLMPGAMAAGGMVAAPGPTLDTTAPPEPEKPFAHEDKDGFLKSKGKALLAGAAGAVAGFTLKEGEDGAEASFGDKVQGALAGAGTGVMTKMAHDNIQGEGGGMKAGLQTGIAGVLSSSLKDGGPGAMASFGTAFGAGSISNFAHDQLEKRDHSKLADALAGGGLGAGLGFTSLGDAKMAGMLGLGGSGASTLSGVIKESGGMVGKDSVLSDLLSRSSGNDTQVAQEQQEPQIG